MTVEYALDVFPGPYTATAAQTVFEWPVKIFASSHVKVYVDTVIQVEGLSYTVAGVGEDAGVTVTFLEQMAGGEIVLFELDMSYEQNTDYVAGGLFTASEHEASLDNANLLIRQNRRLIRKGPRFSRHSDSAHNDVIIPAMEASKFLRTNGSANGLTWFDPGDFAVGAAAAQDVTYTPNRTGALGANVERYLDNLNVITPQDFSAVQLLTDGSYDAQPYFQAMFDAAAASEGTPYIPRGTWRLDDEVTADFRGYDTSASAAGYDIVGAGVGAVTLNINHTGVGLRILGEAPTSEWHIHARIGGFKMIDVGFQVATAIYLEDNAYVDMHNILIFNAEYAIDGVDVLSSLFTRIQVTNAKYGCRLQRNTSSRPNAITFLNCVWGCYEYGMQIIQPTTLKVVGGSFEGCGKSGIEANRYGAQIQGAGFLGGGISFDTVHFEGQDGIADVWINGGTSDCTYDFETCTFQRTLPADYPEYNIRVDQDAGDGDVYLRAQSCTFKGFNGYTPDASRPYIRFFSNDGNFWFSESNNFYQSDLEIPNQPSDKVFAHALVNGSLSGPITPTQQFNVAAVTKVGTGHYTVPFRKSGHFASKVAHVQLIGTSAGVARVTAYSEDDLTVRIWSDYALTTPADGTFAVVVMD